MGKKGGKSNEWRIRKKKKPFPPTHHFLSFSRNSWVNVMNGHTINDCDGGRPPPASHEKPRGTPTEQSQQGEFQNWKQFNGNPVRSCAKYCYTFIFIIVCFLLLLLLGHAQWVRFCGGNLWLVLSTHVLLYSAVLMRKNFSPAVWHRQENVFATSCSFLFSSLPVFLVFSWVTKIETKVERREEEEEEEKNVCLVGLCGCWLEITATYASHSSFYSPLAVFFFQDIYWTARAEGPQTRSRRVAAHRRY